MKTTTPTIDTEPLEAEPEPRYCWRCERETKQVRAESGGSVWWMCLECNETEKEGE